MFVRVVKESVSRSDGASRTGSNPVARTPFFDTAFSYEPYLKIESFYHCILSHTAVRQLLGIHRLAVKYNRRIVSMSILSAEHWKHSKAFQSLKEKETQLKYYTKMKSSDEVLQIVALESKPFGSIAEKIFQDIFQLGPRTSSENDGTRGGKKIEIKSARYWAGKDDCVWQHLEAEHDYDVVMFALLDFHGWKVWMIKKSVLMGELREKKVVCFQGKQGWWVKKSAVAPYATAISSVEELDSFLAS